MKNRLFILIIFFQIVIVIALSTKIYFQRKNILGISINPISINSITLINTNKLKYFYEPKANSVGLIKEKWLKHEVKNHINSDTLNERSEYSIKKAEGVFRIITLGDSFTYGENVATEDNWTELLEDTLNRNNICKNIKKYEVINLGMKGYDTQYEVERYRIRGIKYNPDLVIWLFTDYERILERMMPIIKMNDTVENKQLEDQGLFFNNWKIAREEMLKKIRPSGLINYQSEQILKLDMYFKGTLIYITFPDKPEYMQILKEISTKRPSSFFMKLNINLTDENITLPDHHLNETGNSLVMRNILMYINKNNIIRCE